jgi:hypothetical protein
MKLKFLKSRNCGKLRYICIFKYGETDIRESGDVEYEQWHYGHDYPFGNMTIRGSSHTAQPQMFQNCLLTQMNNS